MKLIKRYLFLIVIFLLTALCIGIYIYYEYNRTNTMTVDLKADQYISAIDLIREFEKDNNTSSKKYVGKILEIEGLMQEMERDESSNFTMILGSDSMLSKIRCSMDSTANIEELKSIKKHQTLTVKGICTGYNPDDMGLGADIILNKCLITKK